MEDEPLIRQELAYLQLPTTSGKCDDLVVSWSHEEPIGNENQVDQIRRPSILKRLVAFVSLIALVIAILYVMDVWPFTPKIETE